MRPIRIAFAAAVMLTLSCGGDSTSQPAARDRATAASCDYYARCMQIGAGKMYETRNSCEVQVRSFWEGQWPAADCDGKIKSSALDICLNAIGSTLCGNGVDVLNTVLVKCAKADVCGGP